MSNLDTPSILIVHSHPKQLKLLSAPLQNAGYRVLTAQDARDGFEIAQKESPELVISEVKSGIDLCRRMRAEPSLQSVPCLLTTIGPVESESALEGFKAGADDYLEPPIEPSQLMLRVSRLIEQKRVDDARLRLTRIVDSCDDAIIGMTVSGIITNWNGGAERMYGYSAKEVWGQPIFIIVPADRHNEFAQIISKAKKGKKGHIETERIDKDGNRIDVSLTVSPIKDELGRIIGASTIGRDITNHKSREAQLRTSEVLLRALFENTLDAVLIVDDDGKCVEANPAAVRLLGATCEEIKGKTFSDFIVADRREELENAWETFLIKGRQKGVFQLTRADGKLIEVDFASQANFLPGRHLSVMRDITKRRQAEKALQESEEKFRTQYESNPIPIYSWQKQKDDFVLADYNHAAFEITHGQIGTVLGAKASDFYKNRPDILEDFRLCYYGKTVIKREMDYQFVTSGEVKHLDVSYVRVPPDLVVVHTIDITERIQAEEQLRQSQRMEAVGRLAGGIAHDFNNLLTAIMGYSDLAMRKIPPEDALFHHIEEIKKASERASSLTRQLLAFSRRQVLQPKVLDLNAFVLELNKMLARLIGEDIQMRVTLDSQLGQVQADPSQIQQVIINLALNARDAMPAGGMLTIETANVELDRAYSARNVGVEPGPYVMLAITDTGAGMDQKTQRHIFEPFYTTKETGKGTGLGLSTVHGIIKQSGGHVSVDSELGHGSTFKIYLPRINARADKIDLSPRPKDLHQGSNTILIVEDEDIVRAIAISTLEMSGYEILDAASGEEALLLCKQHEGPIHLLLTDVVMPRMSGKEVAEQLCKLRPEMKVLFMSGYTTDAVVHHGILDVGTAFIEKPFTPEELAQKVRAVLDESK